MRGKTVKLQATFDSYSGSYVYHCHMLDHSVEGMLNAYAPVRDTGPSFGQFRVGPHHDSRLLDRQTGRGGPRAQDEPVFSRSASAA